MPSNLLFEPSGERLTFARWMSLVYAWIAMHQGAEDPRHHGDNQRWIEEMKSAMPLMIKGSELGEFAVSTGSPTVLDIVYSGITTGSHVSYYVEHKSGINRLVFDALLRFRDRFGTKLSTPEIALMLRHILESDDPDLLKLVPDFDEQVIMTALRFEPTLLEYTQAKMAPVMADFLRGWVQFSSGKLFSVFLICCGEGCAKSICAMLSAGFNPFEIMNGKQLGWAGNIQKALLFHDKETGKATFPSTFLGLLSYLDPNILISSHERIQRADLEAPGATQKILSKNAEDRIAGISKTDWREEGRLAS